LYSFKSHAKLNLNLYVGPPQAGGLHNLHSIFQAISLHDQVTIKSSKAGHLVTFRGLDVPNSNTCTQVLDLLQPKLSQYWEVRVDKHIPAGAGLGGGSSNAATLLMALNDLESLNLSYDEMITIASHVGSDVPYFLYGGQAHVSGTGQNVQPNVSYIGVTHFVLILPNIHCSTAGVYHALDTLAEFDDFDFFSDKHLEVIGFNRLLQSAFMITSELESLYRTVADLLNGNVYMSGSGSTLFIPCSSNKEQTEIKAMLDSAIGSFDADILLTESLY
tara:strand:- start:327 stop:1151 length:825 start_codon:yes stop_codon:yes gene_type:complete